MNFSNFEGCRNRAKMAVGGTSEEPILGASQKGGNTIHHLEDCLLYEESITSSFQVIKRIIKDCKLDPYDIDKRKGELKFIQLFSNEKNELLLRFILRSKESLGRIEKALPEILNETSFKVVSVNIQPKHAAIMEGEEEVILSNEKFIEILAGDVSVLVGPRSFYQTNSQIASKLYKSLKNYCVDDFKDNLKKMSVTDLYCGVGAFGLNLALYVKRVEGFEFSQEAVTLAEAGARKNKIGNAQFLAVDLEKTIPPLNDIVVVNPPRRGLSHRLIEGLLNSSTEWLGYSSCNPETLIRDMKLLSSRFSPVKIEYFDMFPMTNHVEALAIFHRKSP